MGSCRVLITATETLPFYSQYIFSLILYVVNNKHLFTKNLGVHNHDTRAAGNVHLTIDNLNKYHKRAH